MEAKTPRAASEPLKYQTWFLKVSIHCEGCRRKVKKVLRNIDGVFTTTIDPQQQKVTVTGSVGVETLIRKLIKAGKHAEIWPENVAGKDGKPKKRNNEQQRQAESVENHHRSPANAESNSVSAKNRGIENADNSSNNKKKKNSESKTAGKNSPEKSPGGGASPPEKEKKGKGGGSEGEGEGEGEGDSVKKNKKKKKKVENGGGSEKNGSSSASSSGGGAHSGSGEMNLSPTRQQEWAYAYPESESYYYPGAGPLVYLATYNRFCPMAMHGKMGGGPSYYVSPFPYISAGLDHDPYHFQSPPLLPFEIFSDDNANACSLM